MRKTLLTIGLILLSVAFVYGTADAVTGQCVNCHTMHNSQNGTSMGDGPNDYLVRYACVACHSAENSQKMNSSTNAPRVLATNATPGGQGNGKTNAGGDFYWVNAGNDATGHNVYELSGAGTDGAFTNPLLPPGGSTALDTQLTCAGASGCHGNRSTSGSMAAIKGAHHSNTGGSRTVASSPSGVGDSYRFLNGIKGLEDTDWNWGETASNHNEYYGKDGNTAQGDTATISYLCGACHTSFHTTLGGTSTPWSRHPTDIVLARAVGTEYSAYNPDNSNEYSLEAPVARPAVPSTSSSIVDVDDAANSDGAIVMCLSCHRAHGSPEPDLLRWTYSGMQAGSGDSDTGCFVCHTTKNAD